MPISSMTGSIVGKRFYKEVTTRLADDANRIRTSLHFLLSVRPSLSSSRLLSATRRRLSTVTASNSNVEPPSFFPSSAEEEEKKKDDTIYLKKPSLAAATLDAASVMMPISSMMGSIIGKHFYKEMTTWLADDGNGCTVMLNYRTLIKTPSKRPFKLLNLTLAKAIAAEWEYHVCIFSTPLFFCLAFLNSTFPYF